MIPRNAEFSATSITTASPELGDPAIAALANIDTETRATESSDAALARIVAALGRMVPAWHADAACKGSDISFISPRHAKQAALETCGRCAVRRQCLAWAVDIGDTVAILGGTDGAARRPLIKARQRQIEEQRRLDANHDDHDDDR